MSVLLFLALTALASDSTDPYFDRLSRLQQRSFETQEKLRRLGVPSRVGNRFDHSQPTQERSMLQIHQSLSIPLLQPGKLLFGRLLNRLVVGGDESPVLIELEESQGLASRLRAVGVARQSGTQGRVSIEVKNILLKSGRSLSAPGVVLDESGSFGLEASVISQKTFAMLGSVAGSFIAGAAAAQQTQIPTAYGFSQTTPSTRNSILQGVSNTAAEQSKRFLEDATKERPILVVEAGTDITIMIQDEEQR